MLEINLNKTRLRNRINNKRFKLNHNKININSLNKTNFNSKTPNNKCNSNNNFNNNNYSSNSSCSSSLVSRCRISILYKVNNSVLLTKVVDKITTMECSLNQLTIILVLSIKISLDNLKQEGKRSLRKAINNKIIMVKWKTERIYVIPMRVQQLARVVVEIVIVFYFEVSN